MFQIISTFVIKRIFGIFKKYINTYIFPSGSKKSQILKRFSEVTDRRREAVIY